MNEQWMDELTNHCIHQPKLCLLLFFTVTHHSNCSHTIWIVDDIDQIHDMVSLVLRVQGGPLLVKTTSSSTDAGLHVPIHLSTLCCQREVSPSVSRCVSIDYWRLMIDYWLHWVFSLFVPSVVPTIARRRFGVLLVTLYNQGTLIHR